MAQKSHLGNYTGYISWRSQNRTDLTEYMQCIMQNIDHQ